jgi:chromosome segregation ATPase
MRAIVVSLLVLAAATPARAQEPTTGRSEAAVVQELAQINAALREIAATLARQAEQSQLDLLMKRTQMALGEVERGEAQLQAFESERTTLEDQRARLAEQAETIAARTEDVSAAQRDAFNAEIEGEQKRIAQRVRALEGQIAELQNRLSARREESRGWQAVLDRRLSEL